MAPTSSTPLTEPVAPTAVGRRARLRAVATALAMHGSVFVAYAVLVVAVLGPPPGRDHVWGARTSDLTMHLSVAGWVQRSWARGVPAPVVIRDILFPTGGGMLPADLLGNLAGWPFTAGGAPALGYDVGVLAALAASCWAMFWFARRETGGPWAAALAGALFGLNPLTLAHAHNGTSELLHAWGMPLGLGLFLAALRRARAAGFDRHLVGLVLATVAVWWLATLSGPYHGAFVGLLLASATAWALRRAGRGRTLGVALATAAGWALATLPIALVVRSAAARPDYLLRPPGAGAVDILQVPFSSADLATLFGPPSSSEGFLHPGYLGILPVALLAAALLRPSRRGAALPVALAALAFLIAALGPVARVHGAALTVAGIEIVLPLGVAIVWLPLLAGIALPLRYLLVVHLLLALASAHALAGLRRRAGVLLPLAATAVWWFELHQFGGVPLPLPTTRVEAPEPARWLADQARFEAVLDLPVPTAREDIGLLDAAMLLQLVHERPIAWGSGGQLPSPVSPVLAEALPFLLLEAASRGEAQPRPQSPFLLQRVRGIRENPGRMAHLGAQANCVLDALRTGSRCPPDLVAQGTDFRPYRAWAFVLHTGAVAPGAPIADLLRQLFGPPIRSGDGLEIFAVP